jgi:two-component system NtrC family sensor kinase
MASEVSTADANRDLARRVEELGRELAEAREQQAATAGIVAAISNASTDLQRVFADIAMSAARLCDAHDAMILLVHGDLLRRVANHGSIPQDDTLPLTRGVVTGRAVLDGRAIQVADAQAETGEYPEGSYRARLRGHRTVLAVPLIRAGKAIGVISIRRLEVRPLTDRQIELLQVFADQAVIAIENTRLFEAEQARTHELAQSLEYQTATSDVLSVISRSPNDLQPVLDTIARSAAQLCKAQFCYVFRFDGQLIHFAAHHGLSPDGVEATRRNYPIAPGRASAAARSILSGTIEEIPDIDADAEYEHGPGAKSLGYRSMLAVPMLKEGLAIGAVVLARFQIGRFPERQIALLQTFADQAVIAIENTRLFEAEQASKREIRESLEYQTAISNVLAVISRSPTDVQPVFDTIAQSAAELCNAQFCNVCRFDGKLLHFGAAHGFSAQQTETMRAIYPMPPGRVTAAARSILSGAVEEIPDAWTDPDYRPAGTPRATELRSLVAVPMKKDGHPMGTIAVARRLPGRYQKRQIELLKTFADQAVIAIENTRLFEEVQARTKELQESLDRQTATSEVLGAISRSPNEVQPVLDTIVATARRLCQAERAVVWRLEGETFRAVAHHGQPEERVESVLSARMPLSRGSMLGRATLARRAVQIEDYNTDAELVARNAVTGRQSRTLLAVPLLLKGEPIGVITLSRTRVAPFDDKQVALVEAFADQAVIAIENSRLFEAEQTRTRELQEALQQQTATADVLGVISSAPGELKRLCSDSMLAHDPRVICFAGDDHEGQGFQSAASGTRLAHARAAQRRDDGAGKATIRGRRHCADRSSVRQGAGVRPLRFGSVQQVGGGERHEALQMQGLRAHLQRPHRHAIGPLAEAREVARVRPRDRRRAEPEEGRQACRRASGHVVSLAAPVPGDLQAREGNGRHRHRGGRRDLHPQVSQGIEAARWPSAEEARGQSQEGSLDRGARCRPDRARPQRRHHRPRAS